MQEVATMNASTQKDAKTLTMVIYILYATSAFVGVTGLIAIIINYIKKEDVVGTLYESHFRWQMRTFWFGLLWAVVGGISLFFVIGAFILLANSIWVLYRIIKGILRLNDGRPMY